VFYMAVSGGPARSIADPCPAPGDRLKDAIVTGAPIGGADPFTVYDGFQCSPAGFTSVEMTDRATELLIRGEERAIESVFWTGVTDNAQEVHPHLAENTGGSSGEFDFPAAVTVGAGAATTVIIGINRLEAALMACYGGQGVLHVTPETAAWMAARQMLVRQGATLETTLGNKVVVGDGYPGTSPAGAAPAAGTAWAYATGAVALYRSDVEVVGDFASGMIMGINTVVRLVERTYVIMFDGCLLATLLTLA
jgi:hypothetical protein